MFVQRNTAQQHCSFAGDTGTQQTNRSRRGARETDLGIPQATALASFGESSRHPARRAFKFPFPHVAAARTRRTTTTTPRPAGRSKRHRAQATAGHAGRIISSGPTATTTSFARPRPTQPLTPTKQRVDGYRPIAQSHSGQWTPLPQPRSVPIATSRANPDVEAPPVSRRVPVPRQHATG